MTKTQVIRAWKDKAYRATLSPAQRAALPAHPSGPVELPRSEIAAVAGGLRNPTILFNGSHGCY